MAVKKYLLASVGLMALTAASAAHAAPPPMAWSWSGVYIGAHGGYGWGHDPQTDSVFGGKFPSIGDISSQGGVWGFQAGANWQAGSWVGGLEIDLSGSSIKGSSSSSSNTSSGPFASAGNGAQTDKFDLLGSARARLGFLALPNVLIYGTAGPAWTKFNQVLDVSQTASFIGTPFFANATSVADITWRFGLAAGAGVEARLGDSNWLGRVEYLHYDFGRSGSATPSTFPDPFPSIVASGHLTADVVRAGLSYKLTQAPGGSSYAMAMPVKAAPVAPWTWSGFYLGAHAGYGWAHDPTGNSDVGTINSNGAIGGLQAGANGQSGAVVGGLEIDASASSIRGSVIGTADHIGADQFELLSSARARLGYLVLPGTLVYGTGGAAWTRLMQTVVDSGGTFENPVWEFGWVAGAGVEERLGATNWIARVEYLHYGFGNQGTESSSFSGTYAGGDQTVDVVRAGVSYKLDSSVAGPVKVAMPLKARPAAAAWSWDGFYLGGHGGYGWAHDPISTTLVGSTDPFPIDFTFLDTLRTDIHAQGFLAGFQAGANWQFGSIVAGLEADLSATGIKGETTNLGDGNGSIAAETNTDKFDLLGSARVRLGYLVLPNVLFYGTGGAAWTRVNQTQNDVNTDGTFFGGSSPSWRFGWVAGAGGETRLWDSNWLLRLEYLHYDFGDNGGFTESGFLLPGGPGAPETGTFTQTTGHLTADVVRGGLSYKFR
jgi:opacity protein-like surface antigen